MIRRYPGQVTHRVLIAEDDNAVRRSIQRALKFEGYEVATAENGERALVEAAKVPPDAIVRFTSSGTVSPAMRRAFGSAHLAERLPSTMNFQFGSGFFDGRGSAVVLPSRLTSSNSRLISTATTPSATGRIHDTR